MCYFCRNGTVTCQLLLGEVPIGLATCQMLHLKRLCIIKMISMDMQLACKYAAPNQDELKDKLSWQLTSTQTGILRWIWQERIHSFSFIISVFNRDMHWHLTREIWGRKIIKVQARRLLRVKKRGFVFEKVIILSLPKTKVKIFCIQTLDHTDLHYLDKNTEIWVNDERKFSLNEVSFI